MKDQSSIIALIQKRFRCKKTKKVEQLAQLWGAEVDKMFAEMLYRAGSDDQVPHIRLREEMIQYLAENLLVVQEALVDARIDGRSLSEIDVDSERVALLVAEHQGRLEATIEKMADDWRKRLRVRWMPKTERLLAEEETQRKTKLSIVPRSKNHFVAEFFIRDFWSENQEIAIYRRSEDGGVSRKLKSFSKWGFVHNLYSDATEAWFGLIEGDAKRPLEMLLQRKALNQPQRDSLLAFLVIQLVRAPAFRDRIVEGVKPVIAKTVGDESAEDVEYQKKAFETLFRNNKFYHEFTHPLMWSRWALIKSEKPVFVLPDKVAISTKAGDQSVLLAPITPKVCFFASGIPEEEKRILPIVLQPDEQLCQRIGNVLSRYSVESLIAPPSFDIDDIMSVLGDCSVDGIIDDLRQLLAAKE